MGGLSLQFGQTEHLFVSRGWFKTSEIYIFSCVMVEIRLFISNMDGFSNLPGNLFPVLVYYHKMEDVGLGWLLEMLWI